VAAPAFKEIADKLYATRLAMETVPTERDLRVVLPEKDVPGNYPALKTIYAAMDIAVIDYLHEGQWAMATKSDKQVSFEPVEFKDAIVPDVCGMKARDAVYLLENLGMKTILSGRGMVKTQSVKPGSAIRKGQKINLQLAVY
jgi:cell division protein FtsI (penicillin-binding protein 3)